MSTEECYIPNEDDWPCRPEINRLIREGVISGDALTPGSDCVWCTQFRWVTNEKGIILGALCGSEPVRRNIYEDPCPCPALRHVIPKVRRGPQSNLLEFGVTT